MNICLVSEEYPIETPKGGISTYQNILSQQLVKDGHNVHVICKTKTRNDHVELIKGVKVHFLKDNFENDFHTEYYRKKVALKMKQLEDNIDIFEVADWGAESHFYMKNRKKPIVIKLHTPLYIWNKYNNYPEEGALKTILHQEINDIKNADYLYSCSESLKNIIENDLELNNEIKVVNNPFTASRNNITSNKSKEIIFVGSLEERKGILELAKELNIFFEKEKDYDIVLIGKDTNRNNKNISTRDYFMSLIDNRFKSKIKFLGHMSREDISLKLNKATCAIFPSLYENFPYVLLESLDAFCPSVGSKYGGMTEIINNNQYGWICDPFEKENISNILMEICSMETSELNKISNDAKASLSRFDAKYISKQTIKIYKDTIAKYEEKK
ncbi:glycosyltransferase family 4 protein [Staphylococcus kloosii]|uniref:glycosyltransferase family 4 protein n=1 Tax=Staphylococcus kloosii TaxID=29384 RepID=UPI0028A407C7|nr:glycosyltransferase family 4 protein [Staphylococcus kloosii]MDT3959792.1 glycosyltransferase family 4 protein [Staphylococcus kloosii]